MVDQTHQNSNGVIVDLQNIVTSKEPLLFVFSQSSKKIKSKLKVFTVNEGQEEDDSQLSDDAF